MEIKITLPDTVEISAGNATEEFAWADIADDKLADFVAMAAVIGVAKAGNDSASGAAAYAKKHGINVDVARAELIGKWCVARYTSGTFDRRTGDGMSTVERKAISAVRATVKAADEKWYKGADESEKWARMVEYFDGLSDAQKDGLRKWAKDDMDRAAKAKAEQAAMAAALGIKV